MKYWLFLTLLIQTLLIINNKKHNPNSFVICNRRNCPFTKGYCTMDNECKCFEGYITIHNEEFGEYQCNYQLKSQTLAFLLEFVIGFGVGHLYLGNVELGIIKLLFCFMTAFFICFFPYFSASIRTKYLKNTAPFIQSFFGIMYCFWQIIDGVLIGINYYTDGNGISMNEW
jgi:hypothetical protein